VKTIQIFVWVDIIGVAAGLIAVFISAYLLLRAISHPLRFALKQFDAIGHGDLSHQIKPDSNDEMGQLLTGLENMRQSLIQTVTVVRQGSSSIALSADEIATAIWICLPVPSSRQRAWKKRHRQWKS
jgi:methyl-accepting chemotaxis protein-1 (serine sensor receptor)